MDNTPKGTQAPMPKVDASLKEEELPTHRLRPLYRGTQIVWYILGVMEILLVFRFVLKLLGANPAAGFTQFIYGVTWLFAGPFQYVFGVTQVEGSVFEWSTLLAMTFYFVVAWLIVKALVMSKPISTKEADVNLPKQEQL
jgi:YggT family protein